MRGKRMKEAKVSQEELEEALKGSFLNSQKAIKAGLIDHEGDML
jgi:hypothetical protein